MTLRRRARARSSTSALRARPPVRARTAVKPRTAAKRTPDIAALIQRIGRKAKAAATVLAECSSAAKDKALVAGADAIRAEAGAILTANRRDMAAAKERGLGGAMLDRLMLDERRIAAMAQGLHEIATLPDPVGAVIGDWTRPNGLHIQRVRTPLGVIGVIYESRPNVTADAGGLCLKAGNACILRGGSESFHSSRAIVAALHRGLGAAGLPEDAIQLIPTIDRAAVGAMLTLTDYIDVIVPRGGKSLIERVSAESKVPLFKHLEGLCHTYVDAAADPQMAEAVVLNAKMRRTGICGATETLLVDRRAYRTLLPSMLDKLIAAGCELRGDRETRALDRRVKAASAADWDTEYLDAILAVKVVDGVDGAIAHIRAHGSGHTDAIITEDAAVAAAFVNKIDSAIVLVNASTQFADGGEFGMGAEIGIATGKLHARGPVGVEQLTSFKYVVRGSGQCRA